jgi:ABC-type sugar transport system permease subunit
MAASGTLRLTVRREAGERRRGAWVTPALLLAPALAAIAAVSVYPILNGVWLSFRDTSLISPTDKFIGFANYQTLLADWQFWNAWKHTI